MEDTTDNQSDMTVGDKLAFIMNAQAEKKDMNKLNVDSFLEWADQFDGAELFLHMSDFVSMYLGSRQTTSKPKKEFSRPGNKYCRLYAPRIADGSVHRGAGSDGGRSRYGYDHRIRK